MPSETVATVKYSERVCDRCGGSGYGWFRKCRYCGGHGIIQTTTYGKEERQIPWPSGLKLEGPKPPPYYPTPASREQIESLGIKYDRYLATHERVWGKPPALNYHAAPTKVEFSDAIATVVENAMKKVSEQAYDHLANLGLGGWRVPPDSGDLVRNFAGDPSVMCGVKPKAKKCKPKRTAKR